jgi:DNA helicase-2/ATP-dependent DNA helicase PcrA
LELRRFNVPYVITGTQSFFDRKEVRDVLAYLKWIEQPDDELSLLRVINVPPRGMGAASVDKLLREAVSQSTSVWKIMQRKDIVTMLPTAAQRGVASLIELQRTFNKIFHDATAEEDIEGTVVGSDPQEPDPGSASQAEAGIEQPNATGDAVDANELGEDHDAEGSEDDLPTMSGALTRAVHRLIDHIKYKQEIARLYADTDEIEMRIGSLESVINAVAIYELNSDSPNLGDFLNTVTLSGREFGSSKDKNANRNAVSLMTYHNAKGLEFPIVYMVGMEEGVLPHRRSITEDGEGVDEERRLCYVGVTRAQDELTLTLPLSRFKWGKARPTYPSRFLYELTGQADNPNRARAIQAAAAEIKKARSARP